ncbi:hypothetical protein HPP92_022068 [Vanilla planifolia]|uniref:Homeobox domain-containing protein n=1 Tax=Vanilla planifolia TaxID=51239 RepID=A0A835UEX9_VANPL|nr:hypothetical protein HPP92_022068 [Vanilla planifolia]
MDESRGTELERKSRRGFGATVASEATQGLSLSLSSNPPRVAQMEERFAQRFAGGAVQGIAGGGRPAAGPLGPFTGYATILKSSKFLKPAQQLLDEFCCAVTGSRAAKQHDVAGKRLVSGSGDELCGAWAERNSVGSSSSMHSSTEACGEGSAGVRSGEIHRPDFEHKKAKLLYMQEEVCRRYKHYHQQMQLVVSSFESVAGLSSATPYASLTLKAVSKQFRCLKNAISDQLRHVCKVLGDELVGSSTSSYKNVNSSVPKLKYVEPSFRRQKPLDGAIGYSDSHPIWRPQRGLPERAVSVLRAWLFDHFLHPYPTDTDKHMLATQTGLSRNQVSNWFINARVRLWKPMVEEIHMLETRGMAGMDLNSCRNSEKTDAGQGSEVATNRQGEYATAAAMTAEGSHCMEQWHQEKKSRLEDCAAMDSGGGLMSFAYQEGWTLGIGCGFAYVGTPARRRLTAAPNPALWTPNPA